jgi:hypothetical protein
MAEEVWYSSIYKALLISSAVTFGIYASSPSPVTSMNALIAAYVILIMGVSMLMLYIFNKSNNAVSSIPPFLLMLTSIGFICKLLITYKDDILNKRVSDGFYNFSNISIVLILIQTYFIYSELGSPEFKQKLTFSKITSGVITMLGILTGICAYILYIVLVYYKTDGFTNHSF